MHVIAFFDVQRIVVEPFELTVVKSEVSESDGASTSLLLEPLTLEMVMDLWI